MAFTAGYEELGPFEGITERFRGDAVAVARFSASAATIQALRLACEAGDPVEASQAVIPAAAAVSRGTTPTIAAIAQARRLALAKVCIWGLFASLPVLVLCVFAFAALLGGDSVNHYAILANLPFSVVLGFVLWPIYGRPGLNGLRDIRTRGYAGDALTDNIGTLAGKCWLPGEKALYIGHPVQGPSSIPYHDIGLVTVIQEPDGLHSVELRDCACFQLATIVPAGDGSRDRAEALAQTIRLKTMASLIV